MTPRPSAAAAEAEMYDQMRAAGPVEMCREIKAVPAVPDPEELKNRKPTVADLRDDRRRALPDKTEHTQSMPAEAPNTKPLTASAATEPAPAADIHPESKGSKTGSDRVVANRGTDREVSGERAKPEASARPQRPPRKQRQAQPNSELSAQARRGGIAPKSGANNKPRAAETLIVRPSRKQTVTGPTQPALPTPAVVPVSDAGPKLHKAYNQIRPRESIKSPQPLSEAGWKKLFAGIGLRRRVRNIARAKAGSRLALAGNFAAAATGVAALMLRHDREEELLESLLSVDQKSVQTLLAQQDHVRARLIAQGKPVYISVSFEINETESYVSADSSMPGVRLIEAKYTSEPPIEAHEETTTWMGLYQQRRTTLTRGFVVHRPDRATTEGPTRSSVPSPWNLRERLSQPGPIAL